MEFHPITSKGPAPETLRVKPTDNPYADRDARWSIVEQHILCALNGEPLDPSGYMAAVNAVFELETSNIKAIFPVIYDEERRTCKHVFRMKLIELLLKYRDAHRPNGEINDEEFIRRWAKAARVASYHDRNFAERVKKGQKWRYFVPDESFPDDGCTTAFELGRRVWFDDREIREKSDETF